MNARAIGLAAVILGLAAGRARADDFTADPRLAVGGSLTVWIPQSDADDFTDVSLGVRPQVTYWITPLIGVTGTFDFVFVNEDSGVADITYWTISAGARITNPRQARIKPYGEVTLGFHEVDTDGFDDNGIGFRLGGGVTYAMGAPLLLSAGASYSTVSIDTGFVDVTIAAFIFDFGLAARF